MDENALKNQARAALHRLLSTLMKGTVRLQPLESEGSWDGLLKRQVHVESFAAWHQFNELQIETDARGQVTFFHDPRRLLDSHYVPMAEADVLRICETTGLIGRHVESVVSSEGPDSTMSVLVRQRHHRLPPTIQLLVNCSTRQVAALRVVQG